MSNTGASTSTSPPPKPSILKTSKNHSQPSPGWFCTFAWIRKSLNWVENPDSDFGKFYIIHKKVETGPWMISMFKLANLVFWQCFWSSRCKRQMLCWFDNQKTFDHFQTRFISFEVTLLLYKSWNIAQILEIRIVKWTFFHNIKNKLVKSREDCHVWKRQKQ